MELCDDRRGAGDASTFIGVGAGMLLLFSSCGGNMRADVDVDDADDTVSVCWW
jgi:hypothetical protein